jgi:tRNA(Ile)-lysidine synthase
MELKTILDVYLKMMEAHPLTRKVLEEAYFQSSKEGQFLVENPEIMLWRGAKGPVYMIKKNSSLFVEPKLNSGELSWNRKSIYLDAGETLILDWKGRKIRTKQGHKEVSEVLRERNIPVPIRKYIPITEKDNRIYRILFQLWDEEMRDYREE